MDFEERTLQRTEVLRKLQKLYAIMEDTRSNEGMVENAALLAQRLMVKYDIDKVELIAPEDDEAVNRLTKIKPKCWYHKAFAAMLASHFRCDSIRSGNKNLWLVGMARDVEICVKVFESVTKWAERRYYVLYRGMDPYQKRIGAHNSWMKGFILGLDRKYHDQVTSHKWELILVKDPRVDELAESIAPKKTNVDHTRARSMSAQAYRQGFEEGYKYDGTEKLT